MFTQFTQVAAAVYMVPPVPAVHAASGNVWPNTPDTGVSTNPKPIAILVNKDAGAIEPNFDAVGFPFATCISDTATQAPSDSFQILR